MKATAIAPSNIAFIKYWGKQDEELRIPLNGSISMNLNNLTTTTTVEFLSSFGKDDIYVDGKRDAVAEKRVIKHLDRIRNIAGIKDKARVVSKNNFPSSTGLSSSASGFAALTLAAAGAAGLNLKQKDLSILARSGSGSACRSIPDGFVEWKKGKNNNSSYALSLYPPDYWDICDAVAVVSNEKKYVNTSESQRFGKTNNFLNLRIKLLQGKITKIKELIKMKNFTEFGELIESEALELHAMFMTSNPPLLYLLPESLELIKYIWSLRNEGCPVYFTINTGQNIHIIVEKKNLEYLKEKLKQLSSVKNLIINFPSQGARIIKEHLF